MCVGRLYAFLLRLFVGCEHGQNSTCVRKRWGTFSAGDGLETWLFMLIGVVMSATFLAGNQPNSSRALTMANSVSHSVKLGG